MKIIDVHAHAYCAASESFMAERGIRHRTVAPPDAVGRRPTAPGQDDRDAVAARLGLMDAAGVKAQLLSSVMPPYFEGETDAIAAARIVNDGLAAIAAGHPHRFGFFAALPLPHLNAALEEMDRGLGRLGATGIILHTHCFGRSIVDPLFDPIYAALNDRGGVLFLHPTGNGLDSPFINDWNLGACIGPTLEDVVVALHLISREVPLRYPRLRIIIPHLGGALPMLLARLDNQMPLAFPAMAERPTATARRMWYDSAAHGSQAALRCAIDAFGADRIVPGSDFPILTEFESYRSSFDYIRRAELPDGIADRILHMNVRELLGFLSAFAA